MNLFKRATATVALVTLVSGLFSTGAYAQSSAEIEAANALAAAGYIVDHSDNVSAYNLNQNVLRQEIAAVAAGIAGIEKKATCDNLFSDVSATKPNTWACYTVEALLDAGMIAKNAMFNPEKNITKSEALGMTIKAAFGDEYSYDSSLSTSWQEQVVAFAVEKGIVSNFSDYNTPATRGFVFETWNNAVIASEDEEEIGECDPVSQLLGLCEEDVDTDIDDIIDIDDTETETENPIVVEGNNVEISLNPASPLSQTIPRSGLVTFGKFDVTAGTSDVAVNSITLERHGLSNRSDIRRVYFEINGLRVSTRANIAADNTVLVSFNPTMNIKAGETKTIDLVVELVSGATIGAEHSFSVVSADASANLLGLPVRTSSMRIGSYVVETVTFNQIALSSPQYNVGEKDVLLGEFELQTTGDSDNLFKTITLRNAGTSDLLSSLDNLAIYNNGVKVSTNVEFLGREVTFTVNSEIENGRTESYQIRADILAADRINDTINFELRNATDVVVVEKATSFSAPIWGVVTSVSLGTATIIGGDLLLSRDTTVGLNQTVSASTNDVVLLSAKFNPNEAVTLEDVRINYATTGSGLYNIFSSLRLVVDGKTISTYTPASSESSNVSLTGSFTFDTTFTASKLVNIQVLWNVRNNAPENTGFNISTFAAADLGSSSVRYDSNDETATINGSAQWVNLSVANSTLTLTRNDAIDTTNNTIVSGASDITLLWFAARANDVSDLRISSVIPTLTGSVALNQVNNVRLYQDNTIIATRNNFDFSGLNVTVAKNSSVNFKIVADFTNTVSSGATLALNLDSNKVAARNVASNQTVSSPALSGQSLAFITGGSAVITLNSSTAQRSIVTPSNSETSVFKFDIEAEEDKLRLTDLYISTSTWNVDLTAALKSSSILVDGRTINWVVLSGSLLYFPIGNVNPVVIDKDQIKTVDLRIAFNDSNARSNEAFWFEIAQINAWTTAVSGTSNGMRIVSESNGNELTLTTSGIESRTHLLARSKPTVAMSTFTASSTDVYKFTVTADANRKLALNTIDIRTAGSANLTWATVSVYRDNNSGASNLLGTWAISSSGSITTNIDVTAWTASEEVAAGSTVTYYVVLTGASAANESTREVTLTNLSYTDDVTGATSITTDVYNVGVPSAVSSYKY